MKNYKSILKLTLAVMTALTVTSCREVNDWVTDGIAQRLFAVNSKTSVTPNDVTAEVEFTGVPNAAYYVMEISTDSLYDDIAMGGTEHSIIYGEDGSITKSPYTIEGLDGDTKYYFRIKAVGEGIADSKWAYLAKFFFKTKAEQIFVPTEAKDRDEDKIRVAWNAEKAVTELVVLDANGDELQTIVLSNEAKAAGEYTVTGLTPSTAYGFVIKNGEAVRGTLTVSTTAAMPAADYKYFLPAGVNVISNDLLKEIAAEAKVAAGSETNYSATIGIPADAEIGFYGTNDSGEPMSLTIPDGMSITFFGLAGGEAPVLKLKKNLDIAGSHAFITFDNVKLEDDGAEYLINQGNNACNVGELTIINSEVSNFVKTPFRLQSNVTKVIEKLTLKNSRFHDMCSGYSFVHVDASSGAGVVKNINMDGCTLYNIATGGKMFIYSKNTNMESIVVKNSTFYNCIGAGNYWVDFGGTSYGCSGDYIFENCLFTKTPDEVTNKNLRGSKNPDVTNCYKTTDFFKNISGVEQLDMDANALFVDPAQGDFHFNRGKEQTVGDPYWFTVEE